MLVNYLSISIKCLKRTNCNGILAPETSFYLISNAHRETPLMCSDNLRQVGVYSNETIFFVSVSSKHGTATLFASNLEVSDMRLSLIEKIFSRASNQLSFSRFDPIIKRNSNIVIRISTNLSYATSFFRCRMRRITKTTRYKSTQQVREEQQIKSKRNSARTQLKPYFLYRHTITARKATLPVPLPHKCNSMN